MRRVSARPRRSRERAAGERCLAPRGSMARGGGAGEDQDRARTAAMSSVGTSAPATARTTGMVWYTPADDRLAASCEECSEKQTRLWGGAETLGVLGLAGLASAASSHVHATACGVDRHAIESAGARADEKWNGPGVDVPLPGPFVLPLGYRAIRLGKCEKIRIRNLQCHSPMGAG